LIYWEPKKKESHKLEREVLELKDRLKIAEDKIAHMSKHMPSVPEEAVLSQGSNKADESKKRANASLINPNLKKRKGMGAKLG